MDDDHSDVDSQLEHEVDAPEMPIEAPISITIPAIEDGASSVEEEDQVSSMGSVTPLSLSIPPSVNSSPMITTRSIGSKSSFDGFPSNASSASLSSDRELVNLACASLRLAPVEVQTLDLSTNTRKPRRPLKSLKALSELTNLVHLDLSGNAVERVDGLQVFTQLQTLAMPRNHLKTVSAPLFALKTLTHLDLSGNFIAHLPRAFSGLTMLEELNLSGNSLGTLREVDVLAPLSNLLSCNLAANPFCRLPTYKDYVTCKLRSLERLDEAVISRVARDRAIKRFGNAMFSQDACLREAGRAHEDEQNRLLEAQSALEAENLRLKGELQVKSKLLQNKSRAWSSATEQLLQLQQEVAMLNLDRRRSDTLPMDQFSEAEQIAMAIAARHRHSNLNQPRPQSAPRLSPERSVENRRGSLSNHVQHYDRSHEAEDIDERTIESRDAACMPMSPSPAKMLRQNRSKTLVDASCSPLRVIPPVIITRHPRMQHENSVESSSAGDDDQEDEDRQEDDDVWSPPQTCEREKMVPAVRAVTPPATSSPSSPRCHRERTHGLDQVRRALTEMNLDTDHTPRVAAHSTPDFSLKEDESCGMQDLSSSRSSRFPTFEDDTACPAYEDTHHPAFQMRSSSASALSSRARNPSYGTTTTVSTSGSHSLPPSPTNSPSRLREWYRKQNELRLMTPPPSPPRSNSALQYKAPRPVVKPSPLSPFVDKDVLARQIQALQSCKQSLLTEIRNEEHLLHVLKQESAQYTDQIDCLSVNIQACLDGDPSAIRFSFSPPGSPRRKSKKLREEETGRARLEIFRNKLRFAEDKEKEIETTMVRMTKRVLHDDLNPSDGKQIREKCSPVDSSKRSDVPFDKEIFALTHKLQLVIVEKEEIHMQMSQLMAQLRGQSSVEVNLDENEGGVSPKQVQSLAKSRQMVDELRTRHREVTERILLKEGRLSSLLKELKDVEAELEHISSLNVSSAFSPLFQRERAASLDFLQAMRSNHASDGTVNTLAAANTVSSTGDTDVDAPSIPSSANGQLVTPTNGTTQQESGGGLLSTNLHFKELLNPDMLEEIKADIYEKLSQQLQKSADGNGARAELHHAIAAALKTRLQLDPDSLTHTISTAFSSSVKNDKGHGDLEFESSQQSCPQDEKISTTTIAPVDDLAADEVYCDRFDEILPVETYYARKFVMAKERVANFVKSISDDEGSTNSVIATNVTSAQRILKLCERLEAAESKSKFDPVSKIEVDQQGNSRGSLKIQLLTARDLPTAHLRTKNLDPYVCFEMVYPSHAISPSASANATIGKSFRSQTKKKSIYPVWEEDFEFAPILSLNGYLHVRVLNDRRLSREQLVGEVRIPLDTLLHQKRVVEWFSLGLDVPPASTGPTKAGSVVSKLCGGAVRLQLQLYFSSVERYKHVVDELVMRYVNDHDELPPFIDAVGESENRMEQVHPTEQPEQNATEPSSNSTEPVGNTQRRQMDVESHFPLDELAPTLPSYTSKRSTIPTQSVSFSEKSVLPTSVRNNYDSTQTSLIQLSPDRRKAQWESKPSTVNNGRPAIGDKKPYFGFSSSATEHKKQPPASMSMTIGTSFRRSQTPVAKSKRIRPTAAQLKHRRKSVETPECFDEYSPYHPGFKRTDMIDGCNIELGGGKNSRNMPRTLGPNRKTDLSIFKSPSLTRRPPSSGFPERYIGLDNQTCERLKRIFGRMDGSS